MFGRNNKYGIVEVYTAKFMRFLQRKYFVLSPCKKCSYSELFWSAFSRIRTEYRETFVDFKNSSKSRQCNEFTAQLVAMKAFFMNEVFEL